MTKAIYAAVAVVMLVLGAILVVPRLVDWNRYKPDIAVWVGAATGRDVVIDGDLSVALLPVPELVAQDLHIAGAEGSAEPDLLRLKSLRLRLALLPLLSGRIETDSVVLVAPRLALETLPDGRYNWRLGQRPQTPEARGLSSLDVRLDNVRVSGGVLAYRDARSGDSYTVEDVEAVIAADTLSGPYRGRGQLAAGSTRVGFEFNIGLIDSGHEAPVTLALKLDGEETRGRLTGGLSTAAGGTDFSGKLHVEGDDLARALGRMRIETKVAGRNLPLAGPFTLDGTVASSAAGLRLDDLQLAFDGGRNQLLGSLSYGAAAADKPATFSAAFRLKRLDLDQWLAAAPREDAAAADGASPETPTAPPAPAAGREPRRLALPEALTGDVELTVEAIILNRSVVRSARVNLSLADREVILHQASALLPGGGEFALFGFLDTASGVPRFDGTVEASADNLRSILDWLSVDVSGVPADRLRRFSLSGKMQGDFDRLRVVGLDVSLDLLKLGGGLQIGFASRPKLELDLATQRFDLDAYVRRPLPVAEAAVRPESEPPAPREQQQQAAAVGEKLSLSRPAFFKAFDARLRMQVGELVYRGEALGQVDLDLRLIDGALVLRQLDLGDVGGTRASISGSLSDVDTSAGFVAGLRLEAQRLGPLLPLVGLAAPDPATAAAPLELEGRLSSRAEDDTWMMDAKLALGEAATSLRGQGKFSLMGARPQLEAELVADRVDLALLASLLAAPGAAERGHGAGGGAAPAGPTAPASGPAGEASGGSPWSRTPLDLSPLRLLDGKVKMTADALTYAGHSFEAPSLEASLQDGVLEIARLEGGFHGGKITITGRLTAAEPAALKLALKLEQAVLEDALNAGGGAPAPGGLGLEAGQVDVGLNFAGKGATIYDWVAGGRGEGAIDVEGGAVTGFDLAEANIRLADRHEPVGLVGVLMESMSRGSTEFTSLKGSFRLQDGVVSSDDLLLLADGGGGEFSGTVDLLRWVIEAKGRMSFAAIPNAPPLVMRIEGNMDEPRTVLDVKELQAWLRRPNAGELPQE